MRPILLCLVALMLGLAAGPARASQFHDYRAPCENRDHRYTPQEQIEACTAMLRARRLSYFDLALIWALRGTAYAAAGNDRQAIADFDRAISWGGRYPAAYMNRGRAYGRMGDFARATADITLAAALMPNDAAYQNGLCWIIARSGEDLDRARAACDRALQIDPQFSPALDSRALVDLKQGRLQEAWNDYDAAFRITPAVAHHLYGRGVASLRLGREADGRGDLARAVQMDPGIARTFAGYGITP